MGQPIDIEDQLLGKDGEVVGPSLDAEITIIFRSGSTNSVQSTNAAVIHDLPTPQAEICKRFGPCCR